MHGYGNPMGWQHALIVLLMTMTDLLTSIPGEESVSTIIVSTGETKSKNFPSNLPAGNRKGAAIY